VILTIGGYIKSLVFLYQAFLLNVNNSESLFWCFLKNDIFLPKILDMEITGRIVQILPAQTGTSARGEWKKQDFIIETQDQFPKKVCLANWGDKINVEAMGVGAVVTASINIESREFNGRWYTDVKVWKMDIAGAASGSPEGFPPPPPVSTNDLPQQSTGEPSEDDLPF